MPDRYSPWEEAPRSELEQLAYASRLIGGNPNLVLHGGGNSSLKTDGTDDLGRGMPLIWVKPSGVDMAAIRGDEFTALRLNDLEGHAERPALVDAEMDAVVRCAQVRPDFPRPSIETLLHAFLPDRWILHSHADALLAVANQADGETRLKDLFGDTLALVGYRRPGGQLALDVAAARRDNPTARGIVLLKHGLVTFGGDARGAYERHIEIVKTCEEAAPLPTAPASPAKDPGRAKELASRIRTAAGGGILGFDDDDETLGWLSDTTILDAAKRGPATADHILRTGCTPSVGEPFVKRARVFLVPGVGMWTAGRNVEEAVVARDIYRHTLRTIARAGDGWEPMSEEDAKHAEEWPLQTRKREETAEKGELVGKVAWISGAANGIGLAVARRFLEVGAHVVLADIEELESEDLSGNPRVVTTRCDVTDPEQVQASFDAAVLAFGGVDIVVSNAGIAKPGMIEETTLEQWERSFAVNATGHFLVARAAMRILRAQGLGGSVVFNGSKNVLAPGKGFGAYSASKAAEAQLAKVLALEAAEIGVRVNTVHPDAVFVDTKLWSPEMRKDRAKARGVPVEELEDFYAQRNLLKRPVRPADVAETILFFASERSSRTTGAFLTVDGGVKSAFPR